jgi:hypothetical protein
MVTRDTAWPPGTPCWADLSADDLGRARAFLLRPVRLEHPAGPAGDGRLLDRRRRRARGRGHQVFYQAVFGYGYGDMSDGGFRYATLELDGAIVGGIGELGDDQPADVPAH